MAKVLTIDEAIIVLLIGAMNANQHVSPRESARAHHLIWSTRRFRRRSGDTVGKLIEKAKARLEVPDAPAVVDAAAQVIPTRFRRAVFAVAADLLLADGKMDRPEQRFLHRLGTDFGIDRRGMTAILDVILVKNAL
jgi:uncharacterized tellurite resistance protein B-like protein